MGTVVSAAARPAGAPAAPRGDFCAGARSAALDLGDSSRYSPRETVPRASLVASEKGRRPAKSALASLALHALLLALAVAVSSNVAARRAPRRVKLTFVEEQERQQQEQQQQENSPPPSPGPPPPPRRVFVRKMAPPPDLPPAPVTEAPPAAEVLPPAPPPCTDPRGCNQNPGAVGGVEGGTGIPGGTGTGTGTGGSPRPMYLSPGMTRPRLLSGQQPTYTEQARRARVEGDVIVRIEVLPNGAVGEVKVLSGLALLEQEVLTKVRRWRFSSPTYRGQPVSLYLIQRITFRLED